MQSGVTGMKQECSSNFESCLGKDVEDFSERVTDDYPRDKR